MTTLSPNHTTKMVEKLSLWQNTHPQTQQMARVNMHHAPSAMYA